MYFSNQLLYVVGMVSLSGINLQNVALAASSTQLPTLMGVIRNVSQWQDDAGTGAAITTLGTRLSKSFSLPAGAVALTDIDLVSA